MARVEMRLDDDEWRKFFKKIGNKARLLRILKTVGRVVGFKEIIDHFDRQTGPSGKWRRRARSTQKAYARVAQGFRDPPEGIEKAAVNPANKLLVMTSTLRQSFLPTNIRPGVGDSVILFNPDKKASFHDKGAPKRNLPQREFMWISQRGERLAAKLLADKTIQA